MLTGKQRSYLKSLANAIDAVVYIGKNELTESCLKEMDDYLKAHELVKVKIQDNVELDPKEVANESAAKLKAEFVQAIGRKFVLYRESSENKKIELPKGKK
ncbi:MAG: ribosome assembly RNA-binding protein YhbY [Firmicutes bacterium]|nr:ribosome assembly RNA-binding protein YhbY [Bacillota bacterium]